MTVSSAWENRANVHTHHQQQAPTSSNQSTPDEPIFAHGWYWPVDPNNSKSTFHCCRLLAAFPNDPKVMFKDLLSKQERLPHWGQSIIRESLSPSRNMAHEPPSQPIIMRRIQIEMCRRQISWNTISSQQQSSSRTGTNGFGEVIDKRLVSHPVSIDDIMDLGYFRPCFAKVFGAVDGEVH